MAADARATELRAAGVNVISLAAGEPDFDTPERIKEAARKAMAAGQTKYTPAGGHEQAQAGDLPQAQARQRVGLPAGRNDGIIGSKQAAFNTIASLFDEGDEVIMPTPAWVSFVAMIR